MSNRYREALAHLTYGVEDGGGFVLLTGEVGTGKTTVCRCLLQQLPEKTRLAFVLNPKLNSLELLATICDELDISYPENCNSLKVLTDKLSQYLLDCYDKGLSVVVMIDEAQNIETEVLEQIRLLTNLETNQKKLLQIILVGQPELQEKLAQRELRQLAQRITARYHLRPLNLKETMAYILHRVRIAGSQKALFDRASIELLHQKTLGIPRLINTICDRALVAANSRNRNKVDRKLMQEAINDVMGTERVTNPPQAYSNINWKIMVLIIIAVSVIISLSFWLGKQSSSTTNERNSQLSAQSSESLGLSSSGSSSSGSSSSGLSDSDLISSDATSSGLVRSDVASSDSKELTTDTTTGVGKQLSLLDRMLGNQRWDSNGQWSMQGLLSLWNVKYTPLIDGPSCKFAASYGLLCQSMRGNWQQLRNINRPANLKFSAGLQGEFWGTLVKLSGMEATLIFDQRQVEMRLDELSTIWTGEYTFLWQAPTGYTGDLKLGSQGEAVEWLSRQLKKIVNENIQLTSRFDLELESALKNYQRQRGISADGIAGMKTILMINGDTLDGIPSLQNN